MPGNREPTSVTGGVAIGGIESDVISVLLIPDLQLLILSLLNAMPGGGRAPMGDILDGVEFYPH